MKGVSQRKLWKSGRRDSNPRPSPWQGDALPLSHCRIFKLGESGFEPLKAKLTDLQSVPFGHFGTRPKTDPDGDRTHDLQRDRLAF